MARAGNAAVVLPPLGDELELLPQALLIRTGPHDEAAWNYRGVLGWIQRRRFRLVRDLLGARRRGRILEIGYGSGVFLPELAKNARALAGIDVHDRGPEIRRELAALGVEVDLRQATAEALPFEDGSFDHVVAVSSLEFVPDPDRACREVRRVLAPDGRFLVVTPGISPIVDLGLLLLTGRSARDDFGDGRQRARAAIREHFDVEVRLAFPPGPARPVRLYEALRLAPRAV